MIEQPPVLEQETLLENHRGRIVTEGPFVLVCDCPGGIFDPFVYLVSAIAAVLSLVICVIVVLRAAPLAMLIVAIIWTIGIIAANYVVRREGLKHGTIRLDLEREVIVQQTRGTTRTFPLSAIKLISSPVIDGLEAQENERGFEHRWLLVELSDGQQLRLGQGPMHELRPTLAFLRKAGVPGMK
ncbi:MAG TPA: hypothetical protein PK156_23645 [Polyangium sp.]|nr:hypothetical protein [Polyangium sp.]